MRKRNCTNRMNVRRWIIMAKRTASQYDGKFEDAEQGCEANQSQKCRKLICLFAVETRVCVHVLVLLKNCVLS